MPHPLTSSSARVVEFTLVLPPLGAKSRQELAERLGTMEHQLMAQLDQCAALIRWAIVAVDENGNATCQGAYLTR